MASQPNEKVQSRRRVATDEEYAANRPEVSAADGGRPARV